LIGKGQRASRGVAWLLFASCSLFSGRDFAAAQEFPVAPYTDPAQLDCPWPKHSHYLQPWRGYIETKSGWDFLNGIGINLNIPDENEELAFRLLAESGFRTCRLEIGFGAAKWDESGLIGEEKFRRRLALCAKHSLRPTLLINAHHGMPCPAKSFKRQLVRDASKGSSSIRLDDVSEIEVGRTGLDNITEYWAAEILITEVNHESREVTLSKPLPKDLPAGEIALTTLKYAPLFPVGTGEFEATAAGWVSHALRVCRLASSCGLREFDLEIWNELTFGSHFLSINDYYDKASPKISAAEPDFLKPGGRCWELAKRTVDAVKAEFPQVRCIWGFSNTTFHHTPIAQLPPGTDGQSYHPYGTGTRVFTGELPRRDQPSLEGFVPRYDVRMPEGIMQTFIQTESLIRHLNPLDRITRKPRGVSRFRHYMTEHGVLAAECGVRDEPGAWRLKTLCLTRSCALWLNKGIDALHYFSAFEKEPRSFGILPPTLPSLPPDGEFEKVATPPMRALRNLTAVFRGSTFLEKTIPLQVEAVALGEPQEIIFPGDDRHPPLWLRDALAVLPFQPDAHKHIVALYLMTRDATRPLSPQNFRLKFSGVLTRRVRFYDPLENKDIPAQFQVSEGNVTELTLPLVDYPRLLILTH
jgi:hypothetical protein